MGPAPRGAPGCCSPPPRGLPPPAAPPAACASPLPAAPAWPGRPPPRRLPRADLPTPRGLARVLAPAPTKPGVGWGGVGGTQFCPYFSASLPTSLFSRFQNRGRNYMFPPCVLKGFCVLFWRETREETWRETTSELPAVTLRVVGPVAQGQRLAHRTLPSCPARFRNTKKPPFLHPTAPSGTETARRVAVHSSEDSSFNPFFLSAHFLNHFSRCPCCCFYVARMGSAFGSSRRLHLPPLLPKGSQASRSPHSQVPVLDAPIVGLSGRAPSPTQPPSPPPRLPPFLNMNNSAALPICYCHRDRSSAKIMMFCAEPVGGEQHL